MSVNEAALLHPVEPSPSISEPKDTHDDNADLRRQLVLESDAMARYAFSAGMQVPPEVMQSLPLLETALKEGPGAASGSTGDIGSLHVRLAALVAPAMPRTIYLLQSDQARNTWRSILGPLPTVRRLMLASLFFTLMFILSSLSSYINVITMRLDIYRMDGLLLLNVLAFLMSAAGMGATFQALFTAHSYIANGTYDPRYESSFWTQISLGVIAGLVLSQIIPLGPENLKSIVSLDATQMNELLNALRSSEFLNLLPQKDLGGTSTEAVRADLKAITDSFGAPSSNIISKPVLALVGGFSATLVYTVMQRLVTTLESLFKAHAAETRAEREKMVLEIVAQKLAAQGRTQTSLATKVPTSEGLVVSLSSHGPSSPQQGEKREER